MRWAFIFAAPLCAATLYAAQQTKTPLKDGYVGDDTCVACHEGEGKRLATTLHGRAQNVRTPAGNANQSCETCHGPGKEHSETGDKTKIRVFTAIAPRAASDVCVGCHNQPGHAIAATPERAVNEMMAAGSIPAAVPFVHREAVKALKAGNSATLRDFYQRERPDVFAAQRSAIEQAVSAVDDFYGRTVFPAMNVTFGTYPNNIGHVDSPGCFRCHDDDHKTTDGRKIGQDCETCHAVE